MSTKTADSVGLDLDAGWVLHPQVSVRPERFGALLYHFGTRRLSFVKSRALLDLLLALSEQPSARAAFDECAIPEHEVSTYSAALATLAKSSMICRRDAA